jgi:hypothetical protein
MRRRKLLVVLAGLAALVAAGMVILWPRPAPERSRERTTSVSYRI